MMRTNVFRPRFEALEGRLLPSSTAPEGRAVAVSIDAGNLRIEGTNEADVVQVLDAKDSKGRIVYRVQQTIDEHVYVIEDVPQSQVTGKLLYFTGHDKNDQFTFSTRYKVLNVVADMGKGDDIFRGWKGNDSCFGGPGVDYLHGLNGSDVLYGGSDNDFLYGGPDDDYLIGGSGTDHLDGMAGSDVLIGGRILKTKNGSLEHLDGEKDILDGKSNRDFILTPAPVKIGKSLVWEDVIGPTERGKETVHTYSQLIDANRSLDHFTHFHLPWNETDPWWIEDPVIA